MPEIEEHPGDMNFRKGDIVECIRKGVGLQLEDGKHYRVSSFDPRAYRDGGVHIYTLDTEEYRGVWYPSRFVLISREE